MVSDLNKNEIETKSVLKKLNNNNNQSKSSYFKYSDSSSIKGQSLN